MKPIESDLMEPENPRVYRLVLTGGMMVITVQSWVNLFAILGAENGKSRGFSDSLYF